MRFVELYPGDGEHYAMTANIDNITIILGTDPSQCKVYSNDGSDITVPDSYENVIKKIKEAAGE